MRRSCGSPHVGTWSSRELLRPDLTKAVILDEGGSPVFGGGRASKAPVAPAAAAELEDLDAIGSASRKGVAGARTVGARCGPDDELRHHLERVAARDPDPQRRLAAQAVLERGT